MIYYIHSRFFHRFLSTCVLKREEFTRPLRGSSQSDKKQDKPIGSTGSV